MNSEPTPSQAHASAGQDKARRREPARGGKRAPDLENVIGRGASVRRYRYLRHLEQMLPELLVAAILQCLVYTAFILDAQREDWNNLVVVCATLAVLPLVIALALIGLRRQPQPFTVAVFVTLVVFNAAITILSGTRIALSYTGLLCACPILTVAMIVANVRLQRSLTDRVALLRFPGARQVAQKLGGDVTIIDEGTVGISAFDRLLIDTGTHHNPEWSGFLTRAYMSGAEIIPWASFLERRQGRVDIDTFDISHLIYSPSQIYYSKAKRGLDILAVLVSAPLTVPLCILIWLYIQLLDGAPVFFAQRRRGYAGQHFTMLKFRTMHRDRDDAPAREQDERIIRGCRILRRLRLDELPQLVNVWRGEMSLVGPRPVAEYVAASSEAAEPKFIHRSLVLPGITGWAQVRSGYAATTQEEIDKLSYDLYYIKHLSIDLDLQIILSTVHTVLFGRGAR